MEIYNRHFHEAINLSVGHQSREISTDFERAEINAIQEIFPNSDMKGCFYRLPSNIWKQVQRVGLQNQYIEDVEFELHLRISVAFSFFISSGRS